MENLSHYQKRVLNQLYGPLGKTDPLQELVRICNFYDECLKEDNDKLINFRFTEMVESKLLVLLNQDYRFQELSEYKEDHLPRVKDYIEDHYEKSSWDGVDGIKELTKDYLKDCISSQNKILQKTFVLNISNAVSVPINPMQFVSQNFYEKYIPSSRRKIDFLNDQLQEIRGFKSKSNDQQQLGVDKLKNDLTEDEKDLHPNIFKKNGFEIWERMFEKFNITKSTRTDIDFMFQVMKFNDFIYENISYNDLADWINEVYKISFDQIKFTDIKSKPNSKRLVIFNDITR